MRISFLLILLFPVLANCQPQGYRIWFSGTGASSAVEQILVENLTKNTRLTMNGQDTLFLTGSVGIDQYDESYGLDVQVFPNPMYDAGYIAFSLPLSGLTRVEIVNTIGKHVILWNQFMASGRHTFRITGLPQGLNVMIVRSDYCFLSTVILSMDAGFRVPLIRHLYTSHETDLLLSNKTIESLIPMEYDDGDQLLLTGSSEIYRTVIPIVPTLNQSVVFNFIECTDDNGNNYPVVFAGTQVWMAKNLNVGRRINIDEEQLKNGIIEKYCADNDIVNCDIYGGLYQWHEMMRYQATPGIRGICPAGWHIPTWVEWDVLKAFFGGVSAGGKLKATGTIEAGTGLWYAPNFGATNQSGFSALPAGMKGTGGGTGSQGSYCAWWSSEESYPGYAWMEYIFHNDDDIHYWGNSMTDGYAVRCIWDN